MANRFLSQIEESPKPSPETKETKSSNRFLSQIEGVKFPKKEGTLESTIRTTAQPLLGYTKKFTWPGDVYALWGEGEALNALNELDDDRIAELKQKFPNAPWENFKGIDPEKYQEAIEAAKSTAPTQSNLEKLIEEKTGAPLTPKTKLQKDLRLAGEAGGFRHGGRTDKLVAAGVAPTVSEGLQLAGVPEPISNTIGLLTSGGVPVPSANKVVKPSGMQARNFENVKKPTKVSAGKQESIKEAVEGDFRKLSDKIFEENKTYSAMKEDNLFKEKVGDLFEKVEKLAENVKGNVHSEDLRGIYRKRINSREQNGITPDEFDRSFRKEVRQVLKDLPYQELTAPQLVQQFRKNNKSLKELFEPGKSSAYNRAKREALLEYNRSIEDVISKKYPDSEFKNLFEFTNKRWQEINDVEHINGFVNDLFNGKIDYKKAKQLFRRDKENIQRPFKRALGEKGYENFKTLTEDLLSTEKSMSYIKKAKEAGFDELAKTAGYYLLNKKIGTARTLSKAAKLLLQTMLDKPQVSITWKNAFDSLKEGNYNDAQKYFSQLNREVTKDQTSNPQQQHQRKE